jgi:hypothetical protein
VMLRVLGLACVEGARLGRLASLLHAIQSMFRSAPRPPCAEGARLGVLHVCHLSRVAR